MKREKFKDIEIEGRKFRINRFDALTGSYIASLLLMQILPMAIGKKLGFKNLGQEGSLMKKETFIDLQKDCLKVCQEITKVENTEMPMSVMLPDGRWGVEGLENEITIVLPLVIQTLVFNLKDFFQDGALEKLKKTTSDLSLSSASK